MYHYGSPKTEPTNQIAPDQPAWPNDDKCNANISQKYNAMQSLGLEILFLSARMPEHIKAAEWAKISTILSSICKRATGKGWWSFTCEHDSPMYYNMRWIKEHQYETIREGPIPSCQKWHSLSCAGVSQTCLRWAFRQIAGVLVSQHQLPY